MEHPPARPGEKAGRPAHRTTRRRRRPPAAVAGRRPRALARVATQVRIRATGRTMATVGHAGTFRTVPGQPGETLTFREAAR
ncbi:hypothetical protein AB0B40_32030 [Streptomyces sp. NPDC042638]|uniref:hypothetical protein n=1 Tax=Streptomyces sp. NPDC042638 TaxID=3154333 RepID=UPI0033C68C3B